ncbi:hypothetical protein BT69DRAFT_1328789 [Atractiella rhizophila]|nr:hypothetical protein BT69DRAFT_1328789 [Atractiella rhizophila]
MKAYWAAKPRRSNQPNKAAARKIEKSGKGKRDSVASGSTLHTNGTMSKKRGRPSKISVVETDEEDRTSKKKKRKANDVDAPDAEDWADHQLADTLPAVANRTFKALHVQYKHLKNWESKVDSIDTILQRPPQYPGEGHLVAINWHSDFYSWVPTTVANMKCPQKVIAFYERNLTFKNAEGDDVEGSEEPEEVGHRGMELVEEQIKEVEMVGE